MHKTGADKHALFCLESRLDHFRLVNIRRDMERDACPGTPLLVIRNVQQGRLTAEYRTRALAQDQKLSSWRHVATGGQYVRQEARATMDAFVIADSDHIVDLFAGEPVIHDLPPANNMVGLVSSPQCSH